jgi:hypothetical protein
VGRPQPEIADCRNHVGRSQLCHAVPEPGRHRRTGEDTTSSALEYRRTRKEPPDTEGHTVVPVRDREAPGSNPGPPTNFVIKNRRFRASSRAAGHCRRWVVLLIADSRVDVPNATCRLNPLADWHRRTAALTHDAVRARWRRLLARKQEPVGALLKPAGTARDLAVLRL